MFERLNKILKIAESFLPAFLKMHKDRLGDRKGIYLLIVLRTKSVHQKRGEVIGYLPPEKQLEKKGYAAEKLKRIILNKEYSSFQSENEKKGSFGGAIMPNNELHMSASGFPPDLDQEFNVLVSFFAGEMKMKNYIRIEAVSRKAIQKLRGE